MAEVVLTSALRCGGQFVDMPKGGIPALLGLIWGVSGLGPEGQNLDSNMPNEPMSTAPTTVPSPQRSCTRQGGRAAESSARPVTVGAL